RQEAGPATSTVDPAEIRGLVTTLHAPSGACLALGTRVGGTPPLNALEGCAEPGPRLLPESLLIESFFSRGALPLACDRPHEGEQLTGDGGDDDVGVLAPRGQTPEALAEPELGLPGDVLNAPGETFDAFADGLRHFGGMTVGPGAFDEDAARVGV